MKWSKGLVPGAASGIQQAALAALGHGHADGGGDALAQGTGGDLHALGVEVLGVAGGLRAPGAQLFDVLLLEAEASEEELDVLGEAGVSGGEHEAVAADPGRIGRVVAHEVLVEQVRGRGEAHGGAGVAVADLLDGIHGEHAGGVDRTLVQLGPALRGVEVLGHMQCNLSPECGHPGRADRQASSRGARARDVHVPARGDETTLVVPPRAALRPACCRGRAGRAGDTVRVLTSDGAAEAAALDWRGSRDRCVALRRKDGGR